MAEAKIAILLEAEVERGRGVYGDPKRLVKRYSTAQGEFVAEFDPVEPLERVREIVSDCAAGRFDTHEAFTRIFLVVGGACG